MGVFMRRTLQLSSTRAIALLAVAVTMSASFLVWAPRGSAAESIEQISSDRETAPGSHTGDSIDDPAIWVHPTDPSRSLVIVNDKGGSLDTYDLDGSLVQRINLNNVFWGNVDVRQNVTVDGTTQDLVGASQNGDRFYTVDPSTRQLHPATENSAPIGVNGEGFCMYRSPVTQDVYGFAIRRDGVVNQFRLTDPDHDGLLSSTTVRTFSVGSEAEGCVADDDTGALYISQEDVALWRYGAEPGDGSAREAVDLVTGSGGHLAPDIEGLTLVHNGDGHGYLFASAQNGTGGALSYFGVYRLEDGNDFVKTFRVVNGTSSDDCDHTDGVAAVFANLGDAFPKGMFVCQDNNNDAPGASGNQDVKMTRLDKIVDLGAVDPPPPPPPAPLGFVGQATFTANAKSFSVKVPSGTQSGDALLLFASQANTVAITGPGAGWTQIGRTTDTNHVTTIWQRVATASDAGKAVKVGTGTTNTKLGLTIAAYEGTDPTDPVAAVSGVAEPGNTKAHTTPVLDDTESGAWRVSYWSDRNSATTSWTAPGGEVRRASVVGTGGGRVGTLLTDSGESVATGAQGGLTATADAVAASATSWTLLLRPADAPTG
jgi:myo-inositol-hexaphosphate 3-phosphohydrolase